METSQESTANASLGNPWSRKSTTVRSLGSGSFGEVSLVRFRDGSEFALKKQNANGRRGVWPKNVEREYFTQSLAARATSLSVGVVYTNWVGTMSYALLEPGYGGTLKEFLKKYPNGLYNVDDGNLCRLLFAQLVLALKRIHKEGIVIVDFKPDNVIMNNPACKDLSKAGCKRQPCTHTQAWVDNKCSVKVIDYGLSCIDRAQKGHHARVHGCASAEEGTPAYMSPDVFNQEVKTPGIDIWALGVVLYEMMFAQHLFVSPDGRHLDRESIMSRPAWRNCMSPLGMLPFVDPHVPHWSKYKQVCMSAVWRTGLFGSQGDAETLWEMDYVKEFQPYALHIEQVEMQKPGHAEDYTPPDFIVDTFKPWSVYLTEGFHRLFSYAD